MEKKFLIIPWISLFCLLMGMLLSFCSEFGCRINLVSHVFPSMLIAGITLFLIVQLKRKYAVLCSMAGLFVLMVYILVKFDSLERKFCIFVYYINARSIEYNGKTLLSYASFRGALNAMDSNALLKIFGILCAAYISLFVFRLYNRTYGLMPVYGVVALGLLVGRVPDGRAISFLAVGIVLAYAWIARQERGGKHFFVQKRVRRKTGVVPVYLVLAGVLVLGLFVAKKAGESQEDRFLSHSEEYLKRQHEMETEARRAFNRGAQLIRGRMGNDSNGELTNTAPYYNYKTVIRMTVPFRPTSSFFLRGFVGGSYQNGKWSPCETEELHNLITLEDADINIWNSSYDFLDYYITQEDIDSILKGYRRRKMQVSFEYVGQGKWGKYAYVPYFSDITSIKNERTGDCATLDGENGFLKDENIYRLNCYNIGEYNYDDITEQVRRGYRNVFGDVKNQSGPRKLINTMSLEWFYYERYLDYISEKYAVLPAETLQDLKDFVNDYRVTSRYQGMNVGVNVAKWQDNLLAAQVVQLILEQQAEYSLELPALPAGKDYAEYFLLESQKGYCEHFATAGTLMLRAENIPARYVSGYKVTPDMFRQNENGTYTADILDSDAHAWTEVFVGECAGWYPVDMTPGSGRNENTGGQGQQIAEATPTPTPVEMTEKPEETAVVPTEKPTATPEPTAKAVKKADGGDGSFTGTDSKTGRAVLFVFGILFVCMIVYWGVIFCFRLHTAKYRRELRHNRRRRNEFIKMRVSYFLYFLKFCGMRNIEKLHENEWCLRVAYACVGIYSTGEWDGFKRTLQKAAFAAEDVSEEEFNEFCGRIQSAEVHIWSKQGKRRKRFLRLIGLAKK